jgi:2-polyprenyl-3-methyl-5-hydroxy-6-metoxy-1,4-benzoquinol methylase
MGSEQTTIVAGDWPEGGLERVSACPVCGDHQRKPAHDHLSDRVFRCAPGLWTLHECGGCGSAYLDPRPTPATIGRAYQQYCTHAPTGGVDYARASWWRRFRIAQRNAYLNRNYGYDLKPAVGLPLFLGDARQRRFDSFTGYLRFPGAGARVLDLGCGNGGFLWQMRSLGWEVWGVEPDPQSAAHARAAGLDVRDGMLPQQSFPERHFDAVTMSHVIEHLHEPMDTLRRCWNLLKPGGWIRVTTPNFGSQGRRLYGSDWLPLDPPRHLVLFTEPSLRRALETCGFAVSRPPHPSLKARELFKQSAIIQQGAEPLAKTSSLPPARRIAVEWQAWRANRAARQDPALTEELVLLGHKPA